MCRLRACRYAIEAPLTRPLWAMTSVVCTQHPRGTARYRSELAECCGCYPMRQHGVRLERRLPAKDPNRPRTVVVAKGGGSSPVRFGGDLMTAMPRSLWITAIRENRRENHTSAKTGNRRSRTVTYGQDRNKQNPLSVAGLPVKGTVLMVVALQRTRRISRRFGRLVTSVGRWRQGGAPGWTNDLGRR